MSTYLTECTTYPFVYKLELKKSMFDFTNLKGKLVVTSTDPSAKIWVVATGLNVFEYVHRWSVGGKKYEFHCAK